MSEKSTELTTWNHALIWFGAAVSIAEIMTGSLLAPLRFGKALAAILIGHLIGGLLLAAAGLIGGRWHCSAMEGSKRTFGEPGGRFFAGLNVAQLIGWTAVMIAAAAAAAHGLVPQIPAWGWSLFLGGVILLWVLVRRRIFGALNAVAAGALLLLTLLLSWIVFRSGSLTAGQGTQAAEPGFGFGAALELSIAMPVSWLPLIADYTRHARNPQRAAITGSMVYTLVSLWMYALGTAAALYAGTSDVTAILQKAGLGWAALLIVLFSTITTTYLDAYSSGVSLQSLIRSSAPLAGSVAAVAIGTGIAAWFDTSQLENFLCWIGSVFAPMIAVQIADVWLSGRAGEADRQTKIVNFALWLCGFGLYRLALWYDPPCGCTLPVMLLLIPATWAVQRCRRAGSEVRHAA